MLKKVYALCFAFVDVDLTKVISIEKQKKQVLTTYVVGIYLIKHKPIISEL